VGQFSLKTFDFQPHRGATRKLEQDDTGRRLGLAELHRQKIENVIFVRGIDLPAFATQNALEPQGSPPPPEFGIVALRSLPVEPVKGNDDAPFLRTPADVPE